MVKRVSGICRICGLDGKLSFEHVPPAAAFNNQRILRTAFEKMLAAENLDDLRGEIFQRGAGGYTLCIQCNNDTGSWYGAAYAVWAHQAMRFLIGARGRASLAYPFNFHPLRVLKQIACMFFSVNGPLFQKAQPDLVRFVLNRESLQFPPHVRIYAFYTFSSRSRTTAAAGFIRGLASSSSSLHVFSEITFPPFGFVMTLGNTPPPQSGFCEISGFSAYEYRDWRCGITMRLPVMPIYTGYPGDYRTRSQTITDFEESERAELRRLPRHS
jgi:hypothetical protein